MPESFTSSNPPRFLVCAGSTREPIDHVRDWGNIFTGGTGFDVARALAAYGPVDLITSNRNHLAQMAAGSLAPHAMHGFGFTSHADLRNAISERMASTPYAGVVMSAAVSDYAPVGSFAVLSREADGSGGERWQVRDVHAGKVSSQHQQLAIIGRQTEKLVDLFRSVWNYHGVLVKFKLEVGIDTQRLQEIGEASRLASKADLLIANTLEMVGGTNPGAWILGEDAPRWTTRRDLAHAVSVAVMARICPETKSVAPREQAPALAVCLARHCRAMIALIRSVPPAIYSDKENGSSFGEHVRHGLDHLHAVLRGAIDGSVDYEQRRRGWIGEREPEPALAELAAAAEHLERLQAADLTRPVVVHCLIDPQAAPISLASTLARELLFALSHETHHAAILSRLLAAYNITVPENFSLAPSTVAWRSSTCVASV